MLNYLPQLLPNLKLMDLESSAQSIYYFNRPDECQIITTVFHLFFFVMIQLGKEDQI